MHNRTENGRGARVILRDHPAYTLITAAIFWYTGYMTEQVLFIFSELKLWLLFYTTSIYGTQQFMSGASYRSCI
jgi:hypothetical protein